MKIAEINGCVIHMLPQDHTMVICEPDAVFFRCTLCGEIKSVHMFAGSSEKSIPWLKLCTCGNAPHTGGDTQPLPDPECDAQEDVACHTTGDEALEGRTDIRDLDAPEPTQWAPKFIDEVESGLKYRARLVERSQ